MPQTDDHVIQPNSMIITPLSTVRFKERAQKKLTKKENK